MKSDGLLKHAGLAFLIAIVFYVVFFCGLERFRGRNGPWEVRFSSRTGQPPSVEITQARLGISGVIITLPGVTSAPPSIAQTLRFTVPTQTNIPFGRVKFLDTTFLPGTVTLDLYGHEVELLPRILIIDRLEHPWKSGETIPLPFKP